MSTDNPVIVALDLPAAEALELASALKGRVRWLKVGMTLFYAEGPAIVFALRDLGFEVFLDLKLHDIPHQVRGAAAAITRLGVGMLTVHASGGTEMVRGAVESSRAAAADFGLPAPAVLAVTVLTSTGDAHLARLGFDGTAPDQVACLAALARDAGAHGLVCSPLEAALVRTLAGPDALIVTPGVRPAGSDVGDQARIATPLEALRSGASHLVIGRPITAAADPLAAVDRILGEIEGMLP